MSLIEFISSALSYMSCASRFSRRCAMLAVPGTGMLDGDRASRENANGQE